MRVWPGGRIPYSYHASILPEEKPKIRAAFDQWQTMTAGRITFFEAGRDPNRVIVRGDGSGVCVSGLPGKPPSGTRELRWHKGCPYDHEAGHVIGLYHEHQRFDRDRFLKFDYPLLACGSPYYDVVKRCAVTTDTNYGEYNAQSVMHYRFGSTKPPCYMAFRTSGECVTIASRGITPHDASNVLELYAQKDYGWAPFRSIGRDGGANLPLSPDIAEGVRAVGDPALTAQRDGSFNLFVRGGDDQLWHRFHSNGRWSGWYRLGGTLASSPSAASFGPGSVIVAARLKNGNLGLLQYASAKWSAWAEIPPPPGGALSAPAIVAMSPGKLEILVRGNGDRLWRLSYEANGSRRASTQDWVDEGGQIAGNPAAASWGANRIDVVATSASRQLMHWRFDGVQKGWSAIGCCADPSSSPAIASLGRNTYDIVFRDTDGRLRQQSFARNGWSASLQLGGLLNSSPAIVATSARRLDVVAVGTDQTLKHRSRER